MTKHEADVIGGLNMTDQISNEAYKQIMIAAQNETEVADVLDKIRAEIRETAMSILISDTARANGMWDAFRIMEKYMEGSEE